MSLILYQCQNDRCSLGSRDEPGHFTSGITEEMAYILSGDPDAPFGDGICPNCGEAGVEVGVHEEIPEGVDA